MKHDANSLSVIASDAYKCIMSALIQAHHHDVRVHAVCPCPTNVFVSLVGFERIADAVGSIDDAVLYVCKNLHARFSASCASYVCDVETSTKAWKWKFDADGTYEQVTMFYDTVDCLITIHLHTQAE